MDDILQQQSQMPATETAQPTQAAPVPAQIPASIPDKFRDPQTGALQADSLLKSYSELERKMSALPRPPASPDEYCVDCGHGLFEPDSEINQRLFEKGFTPEQVQAVYDLAAERFVPMVLEMAQEFKSDREVERLVAAFGGEEKWAEISRQLLAFGQKNLPPEVLGNLSSSFEGVMALYRMMKGGEPGMTAQPEQSGALSGTTEDDLTQMMRDPRYYRDRDPSFVAKVTEGFKKIYSE